MIDWQGAAGSARGGSNQDVHLGVRNDDRFSFRALGCEANSNMIKFEGTS